MPIPLQALILTAGLGIRLRPLSIVRAKPAIPVAGEPIVRRIIRWLVEQDVRHVTLNLHHLPHTLTSVVGDGSDVGAEVRYSWERPRILGSAGGPNHALDIIGANTFFLVNGDTLTDARLAPLAEVHAGSGALATLAVVPNTDYMRYGGLRLADDGAVLGVTQAGHAARGTSHFIGVQVVQRDAFASIPRGAAANSIGDVYDSLIAARPGSIRGVRVEARFWDIGTVADYWRTSMELAESEDRVPSSAHVAASATLTRSILWDDVEVGNAATLDECIVTDRVAVPAGTTWRRAILTCDGDGHLTTTPLDVA